jgi:hypothetical protein
MPAVIIGEVVADDADFGFFVLGPVVSGSRVAIARELSRGDDVDEIIGDRPALPVGQEIAFEISAAENDQIAERERQPDTRLMRAAENGVVSAVRPCSTTAMKCANG